jgi:type IV pilus assembly protein PilA
MSRQKGFSWIELLVVLVIMGVIASIAIPRLHEAEMSGNESSAVSSLRSIVTAQVAYNITSGMGRYASDLSILSSAALIDSVLGSGAKEGYNYTCTQSGSFFSVTAAPEIPGQTGRRSYFADQSGVIRFSNEGPATVDSPALGGGIAGPKGNQSSSIQGTPATGETELGSGG